MSLIHSLCASDGGGRGAGPYDVPYGALIPKKGTGANLLVPVCLSASAVAYSSTRIETMFMATGTAAGIAQSDCTTVIHFGPRDVLTVLRAAPGVAAKQLVEGSAQTVHDVNVTQVQQILTTQFNTPVPSLSNKCLGLATHLTATEIQRLIAHRGRSITAVAAAAEEEEGALATAALPSASRTPSAARGPPPPTGSTSG